MNILCLSLETNAGFLWTHKMRGPHIFLLASKELLRCMEPFFCGVYGRIVPRLYRGEKNSA